MDEHTQTAKGILRRWQALEEEYRQMELSKASMVNKYDTIMNDLAKAISKEKTAIEEIMTVTGEYEISIPGDEGEATDYKIAYGTPRDKLDIVDEKAVPAEFIRTKEEKSIMKPELLKHLQGLRDQFKLLPNWASIGQTSVELNWKAVKRGTK